MFLKFLTFDKFLFAKSVGIVMIKLSTIHAKSIINHNFFTILHISADSFLCIKKLLKIFYVKSLRLFDKILTLGALEYGMDTKY